MSEPDKDSKTHILDADPLVAFLYILLRDILPFGRIETIMTTFVETADRDRLFPPGTEYEYARLLAERLGAEPLKHCRTPVCGKVRYPGLVLCIDCYKKPFYEGTR